MNNLSKQSVSDSPSVYITEGKSPAICDTLCPISINTALSEKLSAIVPFWKNFALCKANLLQLSLSLPVFTDTAFKCNQNDRK